jgi:hypothetical protein
MVDLFQTCHLDNKQVQFILRVPSLPLSTFAPLAKELLVLVWLWIN